jgi:hypothetical protein
VDIEQAFPGMDEPDGDGKHEGAHNKQSSLKAVMDLELPEICLPSNPITTLEENVDLGSCAVVFPTHHMVGSGAGAPLSGFPPRGFAGDLREYDYLLLLVPACAGVVIDLHDTVFRINAHNGGNKHSQQAHDFGSRTTIRTLTAALISGNAPCAMCGVLLV